MGTDCWHRLHLSDELQCQIARSHLIKAKQSNQHWKRQSLRMLFIVLFMQICIDHYMSSQNIGRQRCLEVWRGLNQRIFTMPILMSIGPTVEPLGCHKLNINYKKKNSIKSISSIGGSLEVMFFWPFFWPPKIIGNGFKWAQEVSKVVQKGVPNT